MNDFDHKPLLEDVNKFNKTRIRRQHGNTRCKSGREFKDIHEYLNWIRVCKKKKKFNGVDDP